MVLRIRKNKLVEIIEYYLETAMFCEKVRVIGIGNRGEMVDIKFEMTKSDEEEEDSGSLSVPDGMDEEDGTEDEWGLWENLRNDGKKKKDK